MFYLYTDVSEIGLEAVIAQKSADKKDMSGCTHWNADVLSRTNAMKDEIVEIYMTIVESIEEELVTETSKNK
ncbi:14016_t:CDS:2 [Cetraspora pellucida]|uniref:14016_t:CDS:1 n=1 Tax=Cetraspora pellucida TaxID=1433469 RepID=A0A9N8ZWC2_9GLOM|nr:14016_t:CDS:2 [Cetraspora pellucida]